jgi:hypothetical protein
LKIRTGRDVHLFFKIEKLMAFASATENKIIIWDEPALDSLSTDQLNTLNKDMQRFFITIGKKRHIFIINYTKFWKFPEYMVVDRADGMIHMREDEVGRFLYIRKKRLEFLWNEKMSHHRRSYKKAMAFGGKMPSILEEHFDTIGFHVNDIANATYKDYELQKDLAINTIGKRTTAKEDANRLKLLTLRKKVALIQGIERENLANQFGIDTKRLREWAKIDPVSPMSGGED